MFNWFRRRPPVAAHESLPTAQFDPDTEMRLTGIGGGTEGIQSIPAMQAAINILSHVIGSLPRSVVDARGRPQPDHPLSRALNRSQRLWPASAVWEYLYRSALTHGVGWAYLRPEDSAVSIIPCDPLRSSVTTLDSAPRYRLYPLIRQGNQSYLQDVPEAQVLVIPGDGFDGRRGVSPIVAHALTVGLLRDGRDHIHTTLTRGMHLAGVVEADAEVGSGMGWDIQRIAALRKKLVELFSGIRRAGGVPILPPCFRFSAVPYNSVDIELVKMLELSIEDVCRIYRVPPRLLYHYRAGIRYGSVQAERENAEFAQYSVEPRARYLGEMVGSQLLRPPALATGMSIRFSTDRLYSGTISERVNAIDQAVARAGILTVNEGREYVATGLLPPLGPVPDGDRVLDPKGAPTQPRADAPDPVDDV